MKKSLLFVSMFITANIASAADLYILDRSSSLEDQISLACPWIDSTAVQKVTVVQSKNVGWSGGEASKSFGWLYDKTGVNLNYTTLESNLPENTQAIVFNARYFNNDKKAEIIVDEVELKDPKGNTISLALPEAVKTLSQDSSEQGESLLICFSQSEDYTYVTTKVTHRNVDGTRPTLGIDALVPTQPVRVPDQP